jgi:hypothetical protein
MQALSLATGGEPIKVNCPLTLIRVSAWAPADGNGQSTLLRIHCNYAENSEKFTERLDAFLNAPALSSPRITGGDHKPSSGKVKGQVFNA